MIDRHEKKYRINIDRSDRHYGGKLITPVGIHEPVLKHLDSSMLGILNVIYKICTMDPAQLAQNFEMEAYS
jgi:ribosomal protein S16